VDIPRIFNITESAHRIHNPFTPEKLATLGAALRLEPGTRVLDLGSGSGEMLCTWARDYGISGTGINLSQLFTEQARLRAEELGVAELIWNSLDADATANVLHGPATKSSHGRRADGRCPALLQMPHTRPTVFGSATIASIAASVPPRQAGSSLSARQGGQRRSGSWPQASGRSIGVRPLSSEPPGLRRA